ncbi:MAG: glycosyltransferase family 4 protein [Planctomycetes bacterium]|nr:glycosyltransferase family 4 protein [Planctomycetota bacterium]
MRRDFPPGTEHLKVMHIITRFILGGAQENTLFSAIGLLKHPLYRPVLVTGPAEGPEGSLLERAREEDVPVVIVPELVREISPLKDLKAYYVLRRTIRAHRPVVVHTHSSKAGILGRRAAWKERTPVVVHTIHGPPFHAYESGWRNFLYEVVERKAAARADALVCVADAMREQFLARGIGEPGQYVTIRSGMEVGPFLEERDGGSVRERLGIPSRAFVAAKIARIAPLKGHGDVLKAAAAARKGHPEIHLLFIGDGELTGEVSSEMQELGLSGAVTFTGLVPPGDIPELLAAADCVVHASYREGLPRAVVQGMLSGKPVVAYALDGTPEVVEDGRTGFLVKASDIEGLSAGISALAADPALAEKMGRAGRERVREEFSWERMSNLLVDLYDGLREEKGIRTET